MFVYKHKETIEYIEKIAYFFKKNTNLTGEQLEKS